MAASHTGHDRWQHLSVTRWSDRSAARSPTTTRMAPSIIEVTDQKCDLSGNVLTKFVNLRLNFTSNLFPMLFDFSQINFFIKVLSNSWISSFFNSMKFEAINEIHGNNPKTDKFPYFNRNSYLFGRRWHHPPPCNCAAPVAAAWLFFPSDLLDCPRKTPPVRIFPLLLLPYLSFISCQCPLEGRHWRRIHYHFYFERIF